MRRPPTSTNWDGGILQEFPSTRRYLVGVSGGRDSVVLLHWLLNRGYRKLVVVHLNHGLRGRASAGDARFVERLAKTNGLQFVGDKTDVRRLAKTAKQSIETAARRTRFEFFAKTARRLRCRTIFLAHHADDLVETFLFNLFRGSGSRAMRTISQQTIDRTTLTIVRPLLHVWRREIDAYVAEHDLSFREDATNAQLDRSRNRMRHRIIPALEEQFGREIRRSIWRAAMIAAEEHELLDSLVPPNIQDARSLPVALQRRAVHRWLRDHAISDLGFDLIENVRALLDSENKVAKVNLPGARHARRRAGKFFIE